MHQERKKKIKNDWRKIKKGKTKNLIDESKKGRGGLRIGGAVCKLAKKEKEELTERIRNENLLFKRRRT